MIGDDVEIGANTTIDRATTDSTRIGDGTKIDNLVQIGHNVVIGKHCIIVAQVGISGSTELEDYVTIGGQAGLVGHIRDRHGRAGRRAERRHQVGAGRHASVIGYPGDAARRCSSASTPSSSGCRSCSSAPRTSSSASASSSSAPSASAAASRSA